MTTERKRADSAPWALVGDWVVTPREMVRVNLEAAKAKKLAEDAADGHLHFLSLCVERNCARCGASHVALRCSPDDCPCFACSTQSSAQLSLWGNA